MAATAKKPRFACSAATIADIGQNARICAVFYLQKPKNRQFYGGNPEDLANSARKSVHFGHKTTFGWLVAVGRSGRVMFGFGAVFSPKPKSGAGTRIWGSNGIGDSLLSRPVGLPVARI